MYSGGSPQTEVPEFARDFIDIVIDTRPAPQEALMQLLAYSGFPDPFLKQSRAFHKKWARDYIETIRALDGVPFMQVCLEPSVASMEKRNVYRISANRLFASVKKVRI